MEAPLDDGYRLLDPPAGRRSRSTTTPSRPGPATRSTSISATPSGCAGSCSTPAPRAHRGAFTLSTSTDGVHWHDAATGTGTGQLTTIDIPATQARYLRVALNAPATVADVRIYR